MVILGNGCSETCFRGRLAGRDEFSVWVASLGERSSAGTDEFSVWVARAGTRRPGSLHGSRMSYLPWLITCKLLRLNPEA